MSPPPIDAAPVSGALSIRLTIVLIAVWSTAAGLALTVFIGNGAGALGAGVADEAGQRLAGVQMLVLSPLYLFIAWKPRRYGMLLWVAFFMQASTALAVAYNIVTGDTDTLDGLPFAAISGMLAALLGFVWMSEQRAVARRQYEDLQGDGERLDEFGEA